MNLNINLPQSWRELSDAQLKSILALLNSDSLTAFEIKVIAALRLSGASELFADAVRIDDVLLEAQDIRDIASAMSWIDSVPDYPVRPEILACRRAMSPVLDELTFGQFIMIENYFSGFIATADKKLLIHIFEIIYPYFEMWAIRREPDLIAPAIILWISSFKKWAAIQWPYLFRSQDKSESQSFPDARMLRESADSMIRALSKGDVTMEQKILDSPFSRAATELNCLARETEDLKRKSKS